MEGLLEGLENVVRDLEGAVEAMGGWDGNGEARREVWEMEGEVAEMVVEGGRGAKL